MKFGKKVLVSALVLAFAIPMLSRSAEPASKKVGEPRINWVKKTYDDNLAKNGFKPSDLEVISLGQSHIDAAWLWRWRQTRDYKCPATFESAVKHFKEYPTYTFHQSAPQYYEWIKETKPELFREIVKAEKKGQWVLVGGMWVEPDCNMPEGESFVRQHLYGQRFFLENFGHITDVSWLLDSFGYNWNLPQFAAKSGQKYMWTNKITWNVHDIFPFHLFWWQAPDGSQVLTHITASFGSRDGGDIFPFHELEASGKTDYMLTPVGTESIDFGSNRYKETRYLLKPGAKLTANYLTSPSDIVPKLSNDFMGVFGAFYGIGDGGHGPVTSEIESQLALQELGYAKMGTADQLFKAFEKYSDRIPTWNDEMYLEFHQGVMTTIELVKRGNRQSESILRSAESAASAAFLFGDKYPMTALVKAWKITLLNQFHDILPGSSIPDVYQDAKVHFKQVQDASNQVIAYALTSIASKIDTRPASADLQPVMVFNPLGWERSDVAKIEVKAGSQFQVFGKDGKEIASQVTASPEGGSFLYFKPEAVPALGWKFYYLKPGAMSAMTGPSVKESADRFVLENELISVTVERSSGLLVSLYDKRLKKEFLKRPSNKILAFKDHPKEYSAWNIADDYLTKPIAVPAATSVTVDARGPLFARLLVYRKGNPTSFKQWITVYSGSPMVGILTRTDMHWKETLVKVEFNTSVETEKVAADIPYAVIERSTHPQMNWDKARTEMPVQKWTDLSGKTEGIALLNFGKYGFSLNEDGTGWRISIIKAAVYEKPHLEARGVNLPYQAVATLNTDQGEHWASLALFPHKGGWAEGKVNQAGYEFNTPMVVRFVDAHKGTLPTEAGILSVDSPSAYIASVKKAEDDNCLVVRLVEGAGKDTSATLKVNPAFKISGAWETDLIELNPKPLSPNPQSLTVPVGHFEIKTIKLKIGAK